MLLLLSEIEEKHGIPQGTMRSAISRRAVKASKKGSIVRVDDEGESFLNFKAGYRPRGVRVSSSQNGTTFAGGEHVPAMPGIVS